MRAGLVAAGLLAAAVGIAVLARSVPTREPAPELPPAYVVDSILPPEEALRRFRLGMAQVDTLAGPPSRDALVEHFMRAMHRRDSAALAALTITRAEFAWLVYPESHLSRPPYRQPPGIAWLTLQLANDGGLRKLLARAPEMKPNGYRCPDAAATEGRMHVLTGCTVRVSEAGGVRHVRLFGRLVELDGRWKIVALDGDL